MGPWKLLLERPSESSFEGVTSRNFSGIRKSNGLRGGEGYGGERGSKSLFYAGTPRDNFRPPLLFAHPNISVLWKSSSIDWNTKTDGDIFCILASILDFGVGAWHQNSACASHSA